MEAVEAVEAVEADVRSSNSLSLHQIFTTQSIHYFTRGEYTMKVSEKKKQKSDNGCRHSKHDSNQKCTHNEMEKPKQKPEITYQHGGWMLLSRRVCIVNFLIYFYYSVLRSSERTTSAIMVERQQQQQQQEEQEQEQTPPPTTSSSEKDEKLTLLRLRLERMKICNDNASNYIVRLFRKLVQQEKYKRIRHGLILIQAIQRGKQSRKLNTCIIEHMKEFAIRQKQQGRNTMMTTKKTNVTL